MKRKVTIGIDEVGRGALAGPVVLSAAVATKRIRWRHPKLGRIRDCKKLTASKRAAWFRYLTARPGLEFEVTSVSPRVIDRVNIARAANLGALRLYRRIASTNNESVTNTRIRKFAKDSSFVDGRVFVLLDGGLSLPAQIPHRTILKGDERIPLIAAASIIAKVRRDRLMARRAREIPHYGFAVHKGYGTRFHQRMIRRHGPSEIHRKTFLTWLNAKS